MSLPSDNNGKKENIRRASSKELANFTARRYASARKVKETIFFGIFTRTRLPSGTFKLSLNYWRFSLMLVVAFIAAWFSLSVASYSFYKYMRNFSSISFVRVLKEPWARSKFTRELGEYNIEIAKRHLQEEKWNTGFDLLSVGVVRSPSNLEARSILAQLHAAWYKDYETSAKILYVKIKDAFEAKNSGYIALSIPMFIRISEYKEDAYSILKSALSSKIVSPKEIVSNMMPLMSGLSETKNFIDLVEICSRCAKISKPYDAELSKFFAMNGAYAHSSLFNYEAALSLLEEYGITEGAVHSQAMSQKMWSQGDEDKAIKIIEEMLEASKNKERIYAILKNYYKEMDCPNAAKYAERMEFMLGEIYDPIIYAMKTEYLAGNTLAASDHVKKFMAGYGKDSAAILKLQGVIFELGSRELMNIVISAGVEISEYQKIYAKTSDIEAMIKEGFSKDASTALEGLRFSSGKIMGEHMLTGYDIAIKLISNSESSAMNVASKFLSRDFENSANILWISEMLKRVGLIKMSQFIAQEGLKKFPQDKRIVRSLILSYEKTGDIVEALRLMSKHPMRYPIEAVKALNNYGLSDKFIFMDPKDCAKTLENVNSTIHRVSNYKKTHFKN